ncbi:MAG: ATP-dependent DNA ligase [Novosphingobium sp.]|nr:ATP-dependent DNA ligase [Novosphingobium sp.]
MEARLVSELPAGDGWQYEPKWDGFRCLAFRDGNAIELMSKSGKPLGRYFPEIVAAVAAAGEERLIVDGELILPLDDALSFAALQARLHPAASRIARLAREMPAQVMLFDCLQLGSEPLLERPLALRRERLQAFMAAGQPPSLLLSPLTCDADLARRWLDESGGALDGIVAKRRDALYQPGERAMLKRKLERTADCVVGGFRHEAGGSAVGSLLLGLYDDDGRLHHVGFTAAFSAAGRAALGAKLTPLIGPSAFDGSAPGGPSRWSRGKSTEWVALRPELVVEVGYDQVTDRRFRHGTRFKRWRPDKAPRQCTLDQLESELRPAELAKLLGTSFRA